MIFTLKVLYFLFNGLFIIIILGFGLGFVIRIAYIIATKTSIIIEVVISIVILLLDSNNFLYV